MRPEETISLSCICIEDNVLLLQAFSYKPTDFCILIQIYQRDSPLPSMSNFMKWAELPARSDIYQDKGTTKWGNHDLYPIVLEERTYGRGAYFLYWVTCGAGLSTFAIGSSYIAVGLTPGEACGAILIGACISSCVALLCGRAGAEKHLGYVSQLLLDLGQRLTRTDYDGSCLFWSAWHVAPPFLPTDEQCHFCKSSSHRIKHACS